jgi:hypothetical protein
MLMDTEYAELEGVDPTLLGDDADTFSWWTLPMGCATDPSPCSPNRGVPMPASEPTPLGGKDSTPLWGIKTTPTTEVVVDTKRRDLLRDYTRRGYAFDKGAKTNPDGHDSPQEE